MGIESGLAAGEPFADYRFKVEVLAVGMTQPLEVKLAPDGRIFFNEIKGPLKIWKPDTQTVIEAGHVETFADQENGFLGFALDPHFVTNHWIYLYYSPTNYVGQRLSRFVMNGDVLEMGSEKVMLEFGEQRKECCHHAGSVQFGPDGNMYISSGDNTHPFGDSESYGPMDQRPGREPWDSQKGASNTQDLRGKILRIHPTPEGGYTIPKGNLFPANGKKGRPEIFVMGCRNPWRMNVDQQTGIVYWGEVGPDASNDGPRGSRGYDEINQARKAGNYGWPYFVGANFPYAHYDYVTKKVGPMFKPRRPVNESPNNTGARVLPPAQPAMIYWPYGKSDKFPDLGEGGRCACAGQVFHYRPEFETSGGFPKQFDNCLLFNDWERPFIKWARLDKKAKFVGIEPFTSTVVVSRDAKRAADAEKSGKFVIRRPEDSQFGPDGCLYMIDYGETWGVNADAKLLKISYQRGNLAPRVVVAATPDIGHEPLEVSLSSDGTKDYDGDSLSYEWRLHPGNKLLSTDANPKVTVDQPGNYLVELQVSDGRGGVSKASLPLVVGNTRPRVSFISPRDGDFFTPGKVLPYKVLVEDDEDGSSTVYDDLMDSHTSVSARWGKGGDDGEVVDPGLALMRQSDCFNCHSVGQKIVGPALKDIAEKYRGQSAALDASVWRVIKGSSGVWSPTPMLAHGQLTPDQARTMIRWIYSIEPGKGGADVIRGLAGKISVPEELANQTGVIEASYVDAGRAPVASLTGKATIKLRNGRIEAEDGHDYKDAEIKEDDHASGKKYVRIKGERSTAGFPGLNLHDLDNVTCRVASQSDTGVIELHRDKADGELLCRLEVRPTGAWDKWTEISAPIKLVEPRCDVVAVFIGSVPSGWMSLDWIQFNRR